MSRRLEFLLLVSLVIVYFSRFAWPLIWDATESARLVSVFDLDEYALLQRTKLAIDQSSLRIDIDFYPEILLKVFANKLCFLSGNISELKYLICK